MAPASDSGRRHCDSQPSSSGHTAAPGSPQATGSPKGKHRSYSHHLSKDFHIIQMRWPSSTQCILSSGGRHTTERALQRKCGNSRPSLQSPDPVSPPFPLIRKGMCMQDIQNAGVYSNDTLSYPKASVPPLRDPRPCFLYNLPQQ